MSNKRITDLTELTTPTTDDVFPVVDIATNTTTKVQLGNLPVPTSVTTALATKENTITPGTTAQYYRGDKSFQTLDKTAVGLGNVDNTSDANKPVSTATQTALNAKQDTLVSGTNIKTLNSTSLLGSGNIVLTANPSGVAGAIQFSNGSAFASDAANLFWDDTNNRLGVGTNSPTAILQAQNATNGVLLARFKDAFASTSYIDIKNDATLNEYTGIYWGSTYRILAKDANPMFINCATTVNFADGFSTRMAVTSSEVQIGSISGARLGIKGSGSTSATTSLLVQNSSGSDILRTLDDRSLQVYSPNSQIQLGYSAFWGESVIAENVSGRALSFGSQGIANGGTVFNFYGDGGVGTMQMKKIGTNSYSFIDLYGRVSLGTTTNPWRDINGNKIYCGVSTINASAVMQADSTTQGFLPPRMTTTQKNAIASPASGLVVYDSTTNKLQCYNGSTWNDLF